MRKGCLYLMAIVGLAFYVAAYFAFKWMGFDTVQSLLLVAALVVALVGLAFEAMRRAKDA